MFKCLLGFYFILYVINACVIYCLLLSLFIFNKYEKMVIVMEYHIPKSKQDIRNKIREEFKKNAHVKDVRAIDMMVIKVCKFNIFSTFNEKVFLKIIINFILQGQMELREVVMKWKNNGSLMYFFKDTVEPKPTDFLTKFMSGHDP